jgi:hypothetical protein
MGDPERGIGELWDEPWEGLPEDLEGWNWDEVERSKNGRTQKPPHDKGRWYRWYFVYHQPICTNIKISADQDPDTGLWFNPHPSSGGTLL